MHQRQVGVGGSGDLQLIAVEHQPGPATTELGGACLFEFVLEGVEAAEIALDQLGQFALRHSATAGFHRVPIEGMVPDLRGVVE